MAEGFDVEAAQAEVDRLRQKQSELKDQDLVLALQDRIDSLEAEILRNRKPEPEPVPVAPTPTTPDQVRKADNLIRESRVEKMRGNKARATTLLQEAAAAAPSSATVLEALGDDLVERKQYKSALDAYKNASALAKGNVGIERKVAVTALKVSGIGSIEDQLRRDLSDSPFLAADDSLASVGVARILSAIIPGSGQIVLGRTGQGITILLLWLICIAGIVVMKNDFSALVRMLFGLKGDHHPNLVVLLPIFGTLVMYFVSLGTMRGGGGGGGRPKGPIDRMPPPVNLPFE